MNSERRLAMDSITSYVRFGVTMLVQFMLVPVMLSTLGKDGYGLWTLSFSILGILALVDMGFSTGVVKFTAEARGTGDFQKRNRILSTVMAVFMILVVVIAGIVGLISVFFHEIFNLESADETVELMVVWILSLRMILGLPLSMFRSILFGDRKITQVNIIQAGGALVYGIAGYVVLKSGAGLIGLAWVNTGSLIAEYLVYVAIAYSTVENLSVNPFRADRSSLASVMFISVAQLVVSLSGLVLLKMDPIVIKLFMPLSAVALYGIGLKVAESVFLLLKQGVNVLGPRAAEFHGAGQMHLLLDFIVSGMKFVTAPAAILMFAVWIFGNETLFFWIGEGYSEAVPVMKILVTAVCLSVPQLVASGIFTMTGHHNKTALATALGAAVNVVLSLILINLMGLNGVALGTLCASIAIDLVLVLYLTGKYYGLTYSVFVTQVALPQVFPALACLAVMLGFKIWFPPWDILSLLGMGFVAASVYVAAFLRFSLTEQEMNFFRRVIGMKTTTFLKPVVEPWPLTPEFERDYREIHRISPDSGIFNSIEWLKAGAVRQVGEEGSILPVRFLDREGRTVAMALFVRAYLGRRWLRFWSLRTVDCNTQRFSPIVAVDRESRRKATCSLFYSFGSSCDLVDLFKVNRDFVEDSEQCGRAVVRVYDVQPRITIRGSFEDYLAERGRSHRKKIKRRLQYVEDAYGELTFERLRDPGDFEKVDLPTLLNQLFAIYRRKWAQDPDADPAVIDSMETFVTGIALEMAPSGTLDVCLLKAGGRILAFDINFMSRGAVNMICGAYEPDAAQTGPGSALLIEEIKDSCARGDRFIEFGGGYLEYKQLWTRELERSYHVRVFNRTFMGRIKHMAWIASPEYVRDRLSRFLKRVRNSRLNGRLFGYGAFHVYKVSGIVPETVDSLGMKWTPVTEADLPSLCECRSMNDVVAGCETFKKRMERGGIGTAIWASGRVAAFGWVKVGSNLCEDEDSYVMNLGPNGAYLFDAFVHPDFRGSGINRILLGTMVGRPEFKGIHHWYMTIDTLNERSIRAQQKIGIEPIETVHFVDMKLFTVHDAVGKDGHRVRFDWFFRRRDFVSNRVGAVESDENG